MCGRAVQAKGVIPLAVFSGIDVPDSRVANVPPRYNAAPSQELWVIRQNRDTGERSLDLLKWGLNSPRNDDADLLTPMPQESSASPNGGPNPL